MATSLDKVFEALASSPRRQILAFLSEAERCSYRFFHRVDRRLGKNIADLGRYFGRGRSDQEYVLDASLHRFHQRSIRSSLILTPKDQEDVCRRAGLPVTRAAEAHARARRYRFADRGAERSDGILRANR